MKRKPATPRAKKPLQRAVEPVPDDSEDEVLERIVARPDGYHWLAADNRQEFGPFETIDAARTSMQALDGGNEPDAPEALLEAERGIGIADWIDPDTGEPAEGQSTPHLIDE